MVPLTAPGMPPPGPSFTKLAESISGRRVETVGVYDEKRLKDEIPALRAAYALALYESWFTMNIQVRASEKPRRFIPGHIWYSDSADGPRSQTDVMIVGKMPGNEEEREGRNLCGPSGQHTMRTLDNNGIHDFGSWYVTNLMKFPHPTLEEGVGLKATWVKDCRPLLWQEIRLVRPKYVLCLGSEAAKELLGEYGGIQMSSNKVHDVSTKIDYTEPIGAKCQECQGTGDLPTGKRRRIKCEACKGRGWFAGEYHYYHFKVMSCIHPAMVLRFPDLETQFVESIKLFCNLIRSGGVDTKEQGVEYVITDKEEVLEREVDKIIARTPKVAITAVDAEWHGEHPWDDGAYLRTIQISDQPKYALCVVLTKEGGIPAFKAKDGTTDIHAAVPHLTRLLKTTPERTVRLCGHFFRADMPQIKWHLGIDLLPEHLAPTGTEDEAPFRMKYEGGLDTGLAAHAVKESDEYKLEVLCTRHTPMHRWDDKIQQWKKEYCAKHDLKADDLEGYGECPGDIEDEEKDVLYRYGCRDVDGTRRLFDVYNGVDGKPGLLDYDEYGLCSRRSLWIAMRAVPAAAEMEATGLLVDRERAERMIDIYMGRHESLLESLREEVNWPKFNIDSPYHVRELLFGVGMSGILDRANSTGGKKVSPPDAKLCNLHPIKATGKDNKKSWADLVRSGEAATRMASSDKESLGILAAQSQIARKIRDIRFLNQLLKTTLRRPKLDEHVQRLRKQVFIAGDIRVRSCYTCRNHEPAKFTCKKCNGTGKVTISTKDRYVNRPVTVKSYSVAYDDDGNRIFDKGLLSHISTHDNRIHTTLYQTLETGRWSSARPNLQALSCDGDTEILTRQGFTKLRDIREDDEVAQYWPNSRRIDFVKPDALIVRRHTGHMCYIYTQDQIDLFVTPEHRCFLRRRRHGNWFETTPAGFSEDCHHVHAGEYIGGSAKLTKHMVTWLCAVQADGSYVKGAEAIRFVFKKTRKVLRLLAALDGLCADYSHGEDEHGRITVYVRASNLNLVAFTKGLLGPDKCFGPWLLDYDRETLDLFAAEVFEWDGLYTRKTNYSSNDKASADWVQILWTLSGTRARLREYTSRLGARVNYQVDIPKRHVDYSLTTNYNLDTVPWDDNVYCVTVPSEFIVVRRNGKVSVTGNSKRREDDYKRILGCINDKGEFVGAYKDLPPEYVYAIRSIFVAPPGHVLIEADYKGAELACMAWMSQDQKMIEHVNRIMLDEKDPNYYDIHSAVAVAAFKLRVPSQDAGAKLMALYGRIINEGDPCPATKDALSICGYKALRVAAKNVVFGFAYGRGAEAIQRQCKEEGADVSIEEAQALIDGLKAMYPSLPAYFDGCRERVRDPGWICSSGGYFRRVPPFIPDRKVLGELERQFMNFRIQNLVAYAASRACDHLVQYRREHPEVQYRIALQIHDAFLLEVPYKWIDYVHDVVLPECMCKRVPIWATDLDGYPMPQAPDPYYLDIDREVMFRWSEKIYDDTPNADKLPARFVKKRKK